MDKNLQNNSKKISVSKLQRLKENYLNLRKKKTVSLKLIKHKKYTHEEIINNCWSIHHKIAKTIIYI